MVRVLLPQFASAFARSLARADDPKLLERVIKRSVFAREEVEFFFRCKLAACRRRCTLTLLRARVLTSLPPAGRAAAERL